MGGAGGGEAPGLDLDHRLEGIAAQGPLLLEVEADLRDLFRGRGLVENAAPDLLVRNGVRLTSDRRIAGRCLWETW